MVDNLSPFTPDILKCLVTFGVTHTVVEFSDVSEEHLEGCQRVILSGRRKNDKAINAANSRIIKRCYGNGKPVLGICYGAEIIALTFGGSIRKMPLHVQGSAEVTLTESNPLTGDRRKIRVYESHNYCVAKLPPDFIPLGSSESCQYELFSHRRKRIFGTQFHPEKSGSDGLEVLQNFIAI